jgi:hypothetical protein
LIITNRKFHGTMPPAHLFFSLATQSQAKWEFSSPLGDTFPFILMSIAHGFREVPGRAHSGGVPFGNQSPRPRRCGASLACRLTSFSSRWGGGRRPRARDTDAAAINSSGRKAYHCSISASGTSRDGNRDPIPDSPRGITLLGDGGVSSSTGM